MWTVVAVGALGTSGLMAGLWLVQRRTCNAGIVDAGWAAAVGALSLLAAARSGGWTGRRIAIGAIGVVWSVRLATYVLRDRVLGRDEDGRYATLRSQWGATADARFFWFFQIQAIAALFFAVPAFIAAADPRQSFAVLEVAALFLWTAAFCGEAIADRQLEAFKANPLNRGRTCRAGLWRLSRHPNYFCEWLIWVAIALFTSASPGGWIAAAAPAVMLFLLFRVTGIPATEAQALGSRGDDYRQYQDTTSVFFPWFPK